MPTTADLARTLNTIRSVPPISPRHLRTWIKAFTGVNVSHRRVCRTHAPPIEWLARLWIDPPSLSFVLGSRGSGKSFLSAVLTHLESRFSPGLGTRILGGSKSQSAQILEAIELAVLDGQGLGGNDRDTIDELLKTEIRWRNGSRAAILPASPTSVRGPHVPRLRLDEVDEIDPELRDAAVGMCMSKGGMTGVISMTSTWHRVGGPVGQLVERAAAGDFPIWTTCTFDVLERCPESRSGPFVGGVDLFERCPVCPVVQWCHAERDRNGGHALAKLAEGHYAIDSLIQKARTVSARAFQADYLCAGPRPDGVWFAGFDPGRSVTIEAEYDRHSPVHIAIDSGVFTGCVFLQVRKTTDGFPFVTVFGDYLAEGKTARENAEAILVSLAGRVGARRRVTTDPAGGARNPIGPTVLSEYAAAGLRTEPWPGGSVSDALALVEGLLSPASGSPRLLIHPRCRGLITALQNYRRAKRGGQWQDYPEDPQHPHEDLVDALRGGLRAEFPEGLKLPTPLRRTSGIQITH